MRFNPTDEQKKILEAVKEYENIKVYAKAGTGKTSTLKLIAGLNPLKAGQ